MKKSIHTFFAVTFFSLATSAFAQEASFQQLICETEGKITDRENSVYRNSLKIMKDVDHYKNISAYIEPLKEKSRALVKKNCLTGKDHREIAPELKKLWTEGCAPIVNGPLNIVCMNFLPLNDGSNVEKELKGNPALAELVKRAKNSGSVQDCSPGVSTSSIGKESGILDSGKVKDIKSESSKQ